MFIAWDDAKKKYMGVLIFSKNICLPFCLPEK